MCVRAEMDREIFNLLSDMSWVSDNNYMTDFGLHTLLNINTYQFKLVNLF